jgi:DNA-binding GntR family transcriptional regulator
VTLGEQYRPLREVVAEEIRAMILRGELRAGERLRESDLALQLGVSRNPVREAIRSLESTGLVEVLPRKGTYVAAHDTEDIRQLLELRGVLEGYAAELAAVRRSPADLERLDDVIAEGRRASAAGDHVRAAELHRQFHLAVEHAAANPYLEQVVEPLRNRTEMVASIVADHRGALGWHEHERIRDAIANGDPWRARHMVVEHLLAVMDELKRAEADQPSSPDHRSSDGAEPESDRS